MKMPSLRALLLALGLCAAPLQGAEASPFANFDGDYLTGGTVKISDGTTRATGLAKIRFAAGTKGGRAKLRIHATIDLPDADRPLSSTLTFKGHRHALISNLAPGIDDGHLAKDAYTVSPRRITARFPFVIGSVAGRATLQIRLFERAQGTRIVITQVLVSSALKHPITWTFEATSAGS